MQQGSDGGTTMVMRQATLVLALLSAQAGAHDGRPHGDAMAPGGTGQRMCAQDARQCPAGSARAGLWVGRSGERCEFDCGASAYGQPPRRPDIQKPRIRIPTMEELERKAQGATP